MADSPGEEGLDTKRGMDTPLYFCQLQNYQPREKSEVELKSHLRKLLNGLHRFNLFRSQWIILDQVKGREI